MDEGLGGCSSSSATSWLHVLDNLLNLFEHHFLICKHGAPVVVRRVKT